MKILIFSIISVIIVGVFIFGFKKTPTNSPTSNHSNNTQNQTNDKSFDKSKLSISDPNSLWVVVNKQRPLDPIDYSPSDLTDASNSHKLRAEAAEHIKQLIDAAKNDGHSVAVYSSYRSYERQKTVYEQEVRTHGQAVADSQSAKPGHSEHQTGLAVDVGGDGCVIEECFGDTPSGKWVEANAHRFGFIVRYPKDKQAITGYKYEPWHLRYVGIELASEMKNTNTSTLEEFFDL